MNEKFTPAMQEAVVALVSTKNMSMADAKKQVLADAEKAAKAPQPKETKKAEIKKPPGREFTPDQELNIINMVSSGKYTLNEARKKIRDDIKKKSGQVVEPENKKETAAEKKERLKAEIEELGGEVPEGNPSVAKFEEALTAAKAAAESGEGDSGEDDIIDDLI